MSDKFVDNKNGGNGLESAIRYIVTHAPASLAIASLGALAIFLADKGSTLIALLQIE